MQLQSYRVTSIPPPGASCPTDSEDDHSGFVFDKPDADNQQQLLKYLDDDAVNVEMDEQDVVDLHLLLLKQLDRLSDPSTPLEIKLDLLNWVFTTPEKDQLPFSFVQCVKVVGCSPLSKVPFAGSVDIEEIRDYFRSRSRYWIRQSLELYPFWVTREFRANPEFFIARLFKNPQYLNEEIKRRGDAAVLQIELF